MKTEWGKKEKERVEGKALNGEEKIDRDKNHRDSEHQPKNPEEKKKGVKQIYEKIKEGGAEAWRNPLLLPRSKAAGEMGDKSQPDHKADSAGI